MSIDYIFEGIKKDYSKGEIPGWLDREILNWLDDDWQETHQIEYDWYTEFCNGEAEDVIINEMINHGIEKYITALNSEYLLERKKYKYQPLIIRTEQFDKITQAFEGERYDYVA